MAKLYVYDSYENRMLVYNNLNENDPMPYSYGSTLSVREFRGSSNARVLWTTTRAMEAWNLTRRRYGAGIPVGYAFKRIWEGGHGTASQHYAGVAFDVGQGTSSAIRQRIHAAATATRAWGYVEPLSMTPPGCTLTAVTAPRPAPVPHPDTPPAAAAIKTPMC